MAPAPRGSGGWVFYLFGNQADAAQYAADCATGWSDDDRRVLADSERPNYIPDVGAAPQDEVRAARDHYDSSRPGAFDQLFAELLEVYGRFTRYDAHVLPDLSQGAVVGITIAAPGNPPEWYPP